MALTGADRGSGGVASSASISVNPTGTLAVNSMGVWCIALDNAGSGGATPNSPASFTDVKSNLWTRQINPIYDPGAASAGVEVAVYTSPLATALLTSDALALNFTNACVKAWALHEIIPASGFGVEYITGGVGTGAASGTPTVTTGSITSGDAVIGVGGAESGDTWVGDADTTNGSWSAHMHAASGTGTSGMSITTQRKIVTATATQTYNPTLTSADQILGWIQLREAPLGQPIAIRNIGGILGMGLGPEKPGRGW